LVDSIRNIEQPSHLFKGTISRFDCGNLSAAVCFGETILYGGHGRSRYEDRARIGDLIKERYLPMQNLTKQNASTHIPANIIYNHHPTLASMTGVACATIYVPVQRAAVESALPFALNLKGQISAAYVQLPTPQVMLKLV
jgi:hypothetical protein